MDAQIFYIIYMYNNYRTTKNTVSMIQLHIVFCTRYKRKIFNVQGVKERFETLIRAECKNQEINLIKMECGQDYVHMKINILPDLSISDVVYNLKKVTGKQLREEFSAFSSMTALWTKSFFVTTAERLDKEIMQRFIESQPNGPMDARKKKDAYDEDAFIRRKIELDDWDD